jgi:hypothetical protein
MTRCIRQKARSGSALLSSSWALAVGCGTPVIEELPSEASPDQPPEFEHYGQNAAALTHAVSCEDVLSRIQANAIARLEQRAEELRQPPQYYYGEPGIIVDSGSVLQPPPSAQPASGVSPENPLLADAIDAPLALGGAEASGPGFSGTTVQVRDVDEADIVKTDGDDLYLLHGGSLVKLRAWPAAATEMLSSTFIEGYPIDMFVHEGKAVVYSQIYGEIGPVDPVDPYGYYPYYSPGYTKLTVLDVGGDTAEVLRESYVEGNYVSSRRHDDVVRTIVQDGYRVPSLDGAYIEYFTPFGQPYRQSDIDAQVDAWLERITWAVTETELGDWLPRQLLRSEGVLVEQEPDCEGFYHPDADLSQSGVTQIFSLDIEDDDGTEPLGAATVMARADRVYANEQVVLLSQTNYGTFETDYSEQTTLHRFDIVGAETRYTASGVLPGYIHNQFSLDEQDGIIRVSTTENRWSPLGEASGPKNRVFTLATSGGWLDVWGQTEVFGQNEQIFATRFIGDLGYVVTFRQTDPLFVVDLSSPGWPEVVGELVIPGFSNFLYPLDEDHLFAIGQDATAEGITQGVALQIFDVADPSYPTLAHKYVYPTGSYSSANIDHRAITFHPDRDRVAFPLSDYQQGTSTLEVFDISSAYGFKRLGAVSPGALEITLEQCALLLGYAPGDWDAWLENEVTVSPEYGEYLMSQCRGMEQMNRGLFREDFVYGITSQAVYAHDVSELSEPIGKAELPPAYNYYYGPVPVFGVAGSAMGSGGGSFDGGGGSAMTAGAGGAAGAAGAAGAGGAPSDSP